MRLELLCTAILSTRSSRVFIIVKKQYPKLNNLDLFLHTYQEQLKNNYIRIHCRTNTAMLGPDPGIYTHVWNMKEIDTKVLPFLEQLGGGKIQKTRHHGNHPSCSHYRGSRSSIKLKKSWLLTIKTAGINDASKLLYRNRYIKIRISSP